MKLPETDKSQKKIAQGAILSQLFLFLVSQNEIILTKI